MGFSKILHFLVLFCLCFGSTFINASDENERKAYIVYMGELPEEHMTSMIHQHHNLLSEAVGGESVAREVMIHSYGRSFNAFVAKLLPHEAKRLSEKEGVVSVFKNTIRKLHTTRSWDFLGMPEKTTIRNPKIESNMIVGLLDTGIWVNSPSFSNNNFGPPPSKWKGKCAKGGNFTGCNNKVIGAQYYNLDNDNVEHPSPTDTEGHGTHTASTAAGNPVKGASLYGIAKGTARGGVPSARIASYKVCWNVGCSDMNLLAGFDNAIADGVDVISVSIGGPSHNFFEDSIAIGSFHAIKKGILVSCAAGNDGPSSYTVENVAPWILTVAASSIDRQIVSDVEIGNGVKASGIAINTFSPKKQMYPLTNGVLAAINKSDPYAVSCDYGTLNKSKVKGKIVYCTGLYGQDYTVKLDDAAGVIMTIDPETQISDTPFAYLLPATVLPSAEGEKINKYINSTKSPKAIIHKSRDAKMTAPFIASFSSRGPQLISHFILKPDLAAPGLSILAAYTNLTTLSDDTENDKRYVKYNILSGTSMATPHASAAAAYVKSFHPTWSPAAIKSALMTTATPMRIKTNDAELASGSGQIDPTKAIDPGLIYDLNVGSYIRFLCKEGYNTTTINLITGGKKKYDCSKLMPQGIDGLNYPTMYFQLKNPNSSIDEVFDREVTYVGTGKAVYKAKVTSPQGLFVIVVPHTLTFDKPNQRKSFKVGLKGKFIENKTSILSALLEWTDSKHSVKSPIVVYRALY